MYTECVLSIASYFSKIFSFSLWERVYLQVGGFLGGGFGFLCFIFLFGKRYSGRQEE